MNDRRAGEILRAGIEAVPEGQIEAAKSLGLSRYRIIRHIVLVPAAALTLRDVVLRRLADLLPPPAALPQQRFDAHYRASLEALLRNRPGAGMPGGVEPDLLPRYDIRPEHAAFQVIDIVKAISSGTLQGTVYDVRVRIPDGAAGNLSAIAAEAVGPRSESHVALVRRGTDGPVDAVHAALKKSPIYTTGTWLARATVRSLIARRQQQQRQQIGSSSSVARATGWWDATRRFAPQARLLPESGADIVAWFARAGSIVRSNDGPTLDPGLVYVPLENLDNLVQVFDDALAREFNNPNNDAYVDAVGAYLASQLAEAELSPFFGFLYATLRATDQAFFGPDSAPYTVIGPEVDNGFPVQATVMQFLDGTLGSLTDQGFFKTAGDGSGGGIDYERVMALSAQVVFGLAVAQDAFGIVHNDFHNNNIAFEDVPFDTVLYYRSADGSRHYAVPTFGKVYKMIDFGRSTFDLFKGLGVDPSMRAYGARVAPFWGSRSQDAAVGGGWNLRGFNNDLLLFVTSFANNTGALRDIESVAAIDGSDPWRNTYADMVEHIASCATFGSSSPTSPFVWLEACRGVGAGADAVRRCADRAFRVEPYLVGSTCTNAVPKDNIHWFDAVFGIDAADVPAGALVYPLPPV